MSQETRPIKVWCLLRDQFSHLKPVEAQFGPRAEFVFDSEWNPEAMLTGRPDIVACVNDHPFEIAQCLDAARKSGIPSLVLQDGILEWRCQYENPLFGSGGGAPQHQPVLADKIACLGQQSARQIASWNNANKVEVTGMPRLDYLSHRTFMPARRPGSRILVMTAKNPGFTPQQAAITLRSLEDVKTHLAGIPNVDVRWRVSKDLARRLGVPNQLQNCASEEFVDLVERVDAVITTPSTAMLEAMLLERPVAALDYHNVPRFVPTAWTISAREHIQGVVAELLAPPARKLAFQRDCLEDCLAYHGSAAARVRTLMEQMIAGARTTRDSMASLHLPSQLLPPDMHRSRKHSNFTLPELYPNHPSFRDDNIEALQVRLARLQKKNEELQLALSHRGIQYGVYTIGKQLAHYLRSKATT